MSAVVASPPDGREALSFPVAFAERMVLVHGLVQMAGVEVGVDFGRGDGFVSEELLYLADVGAPLQQVGGEAVAESVRTYLLVDSGGGRGLLDGIEYHHARQLPSLSVEEERVGGFFVGRLFAVFAQIGLHLGPAPGADR